jgi:hypothetical protein
LRTGPQIDRLEEQLQPSAAGFYAAESTRMARMKRNFVVFRVAIATEL